MSRGRLIIAAILIIVGVAWIGQGSNLLPGTAMSGSQIWEIVGLVLIIVGAAIAGREWMSRPKSQS